MAAIVKAMKLRLYTSEEQNGELDELTHRYAEACTFSSQFVFDNGFILNSAKLHEHLYAPIREKFGLKSQLALSVRKTVQARYKTVKEQLKKKPFKYQDQKGKTRCIPKTLEWLWKPIVFRRPQADLVRNRDYGFVRDRKTGERLLSLSTLTGRIKVRYEVPACFQDYFDGEWSFGTGKLVSLNGTWYLHIPMTKASTAVMDVEHPRHIVGIDRGLRFLAVAYDEQGHTTFIDGKKIMEKREKFQEARSDLQAKGSRSAKRALKRISGRENRWMSDVNHQITKTLVRMYGEKTLFVLEDLQGISFSDDILSNKPSEDRRKLRTWTFYQFEQFLTYKAQAEGSEVIKVDPKYTSQRCPKCGRIRKENRIHQAHEYRCDSCGYRSNDDRVGAMNIQALGAMYVSGDHNPQFGDHKNG